MHSVSARLAVKKPFSLFATVISHGWYIQPQHHADPTCHFIDDAGIRSPIAFNGYEQLATITAR